MASFSLVKDRKEAEIQAGNNIKSQVEGCTEESYEEVGFQILYILCNINIKCIASIHIF